MNNLFKRITIINIHNNNNNKIICNNIKRLFSTTTNNSNNNNSSSSNNNIDNTNIDTKIGDMLDDLKKLDLVSRLNNQDKQDGFSYSKGHLKKIMDAIEKEIIENAEKKMESSEETYERLLDDLKLRIAQSEKELVAEKRKSNIKYYVLSILLSIIIYQQYTIGCQRVESNKQQFDENWEKLRVMVTERDQQREKKQSLINNLSNQVLQQIESKSIYSIDADDIKYNVDSIVNEYCIENKSPSDILSKSNKNLSNSKL